MATINNFLMTTNNFSKRKLVQRKVNIITMGCSKNLVDSEQLACQLEANDFKVFHESEQPQPITIINTCGFILDAKEESIEKILEAVDLKKNGKIEILIVFGCLSGRYKKDLPKEIPEVDAFFGSNSVVEILRYLDAQFFPEKMISRKTATPQHYAYLKISEGCSHQCAFCAIPKIRGKQISKPIEQIIQEANILVENGVKEILLVAQDLTHYGVDIYKKHQLPHLVEEIAKINGLEWIRLHYAYPNSFQLSLLDVMKDYPNICKYIDIPIQHINDNVLKAMNRKITGKDIRNLLDTIKTKIPNIALRTSLIVGFPNESAKAYQELENFVQEGYFDRLGVFTYSHEENTPAYQLNDRISKKEKEERRERLMAIQHDVSLLKNQQKIGKQLKIIIDESNKNQNGFQSIGRTEFDSPEVDNIVIVHSKKQLKVGHFYTANIENAYAFDLEASI